MFRKPMRNIKKTFAPTLLATLILTGCAERQIKDSAYNYANAMANYQVAEAKAYATEETQHTTLVVAERLVKRVDPEYIASDTPAQVTILSAEKTSDTSAYAVYHKKTPIKDFTDTLQLRKRQGKWLAHVELQAPTKPANS